MAPISGASAHPPASSNGAMTTFVTISAAYANPKRPTPAAENVSTHMSPNGSWPMPLTYESDALSNRDDASAETNTEHVSPTPSSSSRSTTSYTGHSSSDISTTIKSHTSYTLTPNSTRDTTVLRCHQGSHIGLIPRCFSSASQFFCSKSSQNLLESVVRVLTLFVYWVAPTSKNISFPGTR